MLRVTITICHVDDLPLPAWIHPESERGKAMLARKAARAAARARESVA